jgi:hypothetical protein
MPKQNQKDDNGDGDAKQPKKNRGHLNLLEFRIMTLSRNSEAIHDNSRIGKAYGSVVMRCLTQARSSRNGNCLARMECARDGAERHHARNNA